VRWQAWEGLLVHLGLGTRCQVHLSAAVVAPGRGDGTSSALSETGRVL
jgi:hypothetical protein